jgi:voltage-gated sodium channel
VQEQCRRITEAHWFERTIVGLILFNALLIGLETSPEIMAQQGQWLLLGNHLILGVFIIEAALKLGAVAPRIGRYFGSGWNQFDFAIIVLSFIPASGEFAMVARLIRLLRVLRLVTTIPKLRLVVATLVHSIPSMVHVILLLAILFYIYGVLGYFLYHQHDPEHWGTLGTAMLTLFQVVTLEGWADIMRTAMQVKPFAWVYFVSFVVIGTFVVINLFIAVVINNLEETKHHELEAMAETPSREQLLAELRGTLDALGRLEARLARSEDVAAGRVRG